MTKEVLLPQMSLFFSVRNQTLRQTGPDCGLNSHWVYYQYRGRLL